MADIDDFSSPLDMSESCGQTQCPHIGRIARLEAQHDHVLRTVQKIDEKIDKVLLSLGRVEVLESKHIHHNEALARAFKRIEDTEEQVSDTAKALNDLISQIRGMSRLAVVLWTLLSGIVGTVATKVFFGG